MYFILYFSYIKRGSSFLKEALEYNTTLIPIYYYLAIRPANNWHVSARDKENLADSDSERWRVEVSFLLYRQISTYPVV